MPVDVQILPAKYAPDPAETPLSFLARVADSTSTDYAMLHSATAQAGASVIGLDPLCRVMFDAQGRAVIEANASVPTPALPQGAPLATLEAAINSVRFDTPQALVGWLGFISYDIGRFLE